MREVWENIRVLQYSSNFYAGAEQSGARRCMKCFSCFCINCKVPWHSKVNCYDYKRSHPYPLREDQLLNTLATKKHWRQCLKCKNMVELSEGCYHITCRCGYEFCYTCGAEWKNKKPTCSCPIWDVRNIIREQQPRQVPQHVQPPIRHEQPQGVQVQQPVIPQRHVIHEQPRHGLPRPVQPQHNIHQQQRRGQPVMNEQPRHVQPQHGHQVRRQQQQNIQQHNYNHYEQPRQVRREDDYDYYG